MHNFPQTSGDQQMPGDEQRHAPQHPPVNQQLSNAQQQYPEQQAPYYPQGSDYQQTPGYPQASAYLQSPYPPQIQQALHQKFKRLSLWHSIFFWLGAILIIPSQGFHPIPLISKSIRTVFDAFASLLPFIEKGHFYILCFYSGVAAWIISFILFVIRASKLPAPIVMGFRISWLRMLHRIIKIIFFALSVLGIVVMFMMLIAFAGIAPRS
ncbi:MAG: hypothetical protein Q4C71_01290 [Microbacteriaceae bacterium]|nr:hypothetical protein [Microbacteriaceae bacterium]